MQNFNEFLAWEATTRDTIDFKKAYVDICGDVLAGLVLSEIIYWYLPSKGASTNKLRVQKENQQWIACTRYEWWERTRLTPRQMDRVFRVLKEKKLIEKKVFRFDGKPTVHIRIDEKLFMEQWQQVVKNPPANPFSPNGKNEARSHQTVKTNLPNGENVFDKSVKTLTETTTETTTQKKDSSPGGETVHFLDTAMSGSEYLLLRDAFQTDPTVQWIAKKNIPQYPKWNYKEHIVKVWGPEKRGMAGYILSQVLGTANKGQWREWRFDEPAKPEELYAFKYWYKSHHPNWQFPCKAESIRLYFDEFRGTSDYPMLCSFYRDWLRQEAIHEQAYPPKPVATPVEEPVDRKAEMDAVIANALCMMKGQVSA